MKNTDLYFYRFLRDFLREYLIVRRNFSNQTLRAYRQSLNQFRLYLRDKQGINFDKVDFTCFSRKRIYEFLVGLGMNTVVLLKP